MDQGGPAEDGSPWQHTQCVCLCWDLRPKGGRDSSQHPTLERILTPVTSRSHWGWEAWVALPGTALVGKTPSQEGSAAIVPFRQGQAL